MRHLYWKKRKRLEIAIAIAIISLPVLLYAHTFFSGRETVLHFGGFSFDHGFKSNIGYVWNVLIKSISLFLMTFWFCSIPNYKNYLVLIPIVLWLDNLVRKTIFRNVVLEEYLLEISLAINIGYIILIFLLRNIFQLYLKDNTVVVSGLARKKNILRAAVMQKTKTNGLASSSIGDLFLLQEYLEKQIQDIVFYRSAKYFKKSDVWMILMFAFLPFIFYAYLLVDPNAELVYIFGYVVDSHGFDSFSSFLWLFAMKVSLLLPLLFWFVTNRSWWKYALLSPIILTVYQLVELIQNSTDQADEHEIIRSAPLIIIVVGALLVISQRINRNYRTLDTHEKIVQQIQDRIRAMSDQKNKALFSENLQDLKNKDGTLEILTALKAKVEAQLDRA